MAKILTFDFMAADDGKDTELEVRFDAGGASESIQFLTALSAFVASYGGAAVFDAPAAAAPAAPAPEPKPAPKPRAVRSVAPPAPAPEPAPKADKTLQPYPTQEQQIQQGIENGMLPPVTETVIAPLGSAQLAASASAPASSPSPAPAAPTPRAAVQQAPAPKATPAPVKTGQPAAPSAVSTSVTPPSAPAAAVPEALPLEQVPADLANAKSFRAVLVLLQSEKYGCTTLDQLVAACHTYKNVPCVGRYMVPNPDPEQAIEVRIQRFLEATGAAA